MGGDAVKSKINHVAISSPQYALLGKFYEALFGMRNSPNNRPARAVSLGDGYVGLNLNMRSPGRPGGLDHFGIEVEDVGTIFERIEKGYPTIKWLKRPGNRPFAGISTHDPNGNIFDLSQAGMANRTDVYEDGEWSQDRYIDHIAIRALEPERCAQFYADVFDLALMNRRPGDSHYAVTDGRMSIVLMPWDITLYEGTGVVRPSPDHFGFSVENIEAFKRDIEEVSINHCLVPKRLGVGKEAQIYLDLFNSSCPFGQHFHMSDPDGHLIDVTERPAA
jgi:catechol 2,3-dioxygenase-like lactoylglutathione lyase family enzyme